MREKARILSILTASLAVVLFLCGCRAWEYDVVKNGIRFEKIYRSPEGTGTGYMTENHDMQGFPCTKGWIHFDRDWRLLSCQLSRDLMFKGTLLPARTWLHLPRHDGQTGYVCSFPHDYQVQGYPCRGSGGYKGTQTAFYESGRLRSFYPPEDMIINGIPCAATLLVNVILDENGGLISCRLARDLQRSGENYQKGLTVEFDKDGKVK